MAHYLSLAGRNNVTLPQLPKGFYWGIGKRMNLAYDDSQSVNIYKEDSAKMPHLLLCVWGRNNEGERIFALRANNEETNRFDVLESFLNLREAVQKMASLCAGS